MFRIIRSERVRGSFFSRSVFFASRRVVDAPSIWEDAFVQHAKPIGRRDGSLHGFSVHTNIKLLLISS